MKIRFLAAVLLCAAACAKAAPATTALSRAELMDPASCKACHPDHLREWQRSMHAYASDDPVFVAMNQRGQRETHGQLGSFCIQCHAPMALQTGTSTDGLNLGSLPAAMKGVTCFFCHSVESISGTHNAPLKLAGDELLRGGIADPVANEAHQAVYSPIHDRERPESAGLCGSCHDIVNGHGAAVERTFQEWQGTIFSKPPVSLSCSKCHMEGRPGLAAEAPNVLLRTVHGHAFPAVDTALTDFAEKDLARAEVQKALDTTLQAELCVESFPSPRIHVVLDNVGAGHLWPSGAAQDRRAWAEVIATKNGRVVYQSGVLKPDQPIEQLPDPDLWLIRDCMYDEAGQEVHMFWEAAQLKSNQLTGPITTNLLDPQYYLTHVTRRFAEASSTGSPVLAELPDRITLRVRIQPVATVVLEDLVQSGDLAPAVRDAMPIFDLGGTQLVWTATSAFSSVTRQGSRLSCVTTGLNAPVDAQLMTVSHRLCPSL